jgi:mono/diheme cytochrome c family protein
MKRIFHLNGMVWRISLIAIMTNFLTTSGQTVNEQQFPIPENINKIFQASCLPCHGSNGGKMATGKLNFTEWERYGADKEAEKALFICTTVRKGTMPPKMVRDSKPELIPTKAQIDLICNWASSLKPEKGAK